LERCRFGHAKEQGEMINPKVPSEEDPAQHPVEPEFPTDEDPANPHSDEGKSGADENSVETVKSKL
jgi:hypothetical protein